MSGKRQGTPRARVLTRRTLIKAGAAAAVLAGWPRIARAQTQAPALPPPPDWGVINPTTPLPTTDPFATPALRATWWIPEPPGSAMPELDNAWRRMCDGVQTWKAVSVPQLFALDESLDNPADMNLAATPLPSLRRNRQARSPNWSGAWVEATGGLHLTTIVGEFTAPKATRPVTVGERRHCRSSIWIGLDGQADYENASLPQIGVSQELTKDIPGYVDPALHLPWFEWWASANPRRRKPPKSTRPNYIDPTILPIAIGDVIICWIDIIPFSNASKPGVTQVARMMIKNDTKHILVLPFYVYPPKIGAGPRYPRVTGATAEWIVERPARQDLQDQFTMPHFAADLPFKSCVAGLSTQVGQPATQQHTLAVSQQIAMYQVPDEGGSTYEIAVPNRATGPTDFSVQVRGS